MNIINFQIFTDLHDLSLMFTSPHVQPDTNVHWSTPVSTCRWHWLAEICWINPNHQLLVDITQTYTDKNIVLLTDECLGNILKPNIHRPLTVIVRVKPLSGSRHLNGEVKKLWFDYIDQYTHRHTQTQTRTHSYTHTHIHMHTFESVYIGLHKSCLPMEDCWKLKVCKCLLTSGCIELAKVSFQTHWAVSMYLCITVPLIVACSSASRRFIKVWEKISPGIWRALQ